MVITSQMKDTIMQKILKGLRQFFVNSLFQQAETTRELSRAFDLVEIEKLQKGMVLSSIDN